MVAYRCDICHKKFSAKWLYKMHLEKNISCKIKINSVNNTTYPEGIDIYYYDILNADESAYIVLQV